MGAPKAETKRSTPRRPVCRRCGTAIHVPDGWSHGPAVRKHYWARHREVMLPAGKREGR